jgi:hypothetical protein
MNGDIQAARKLLVELRKTYRSVPREAQLEVKEALQSLSPEEQSRTVGDKCDSAFRP